MAQKLKNRQKISVNKVLTKAVVDETAPVSPPPPPLVVVNQLLKSPYTRSTELRIGNDTYHIPSAYLDKYPKLQPSSPFIHPSTLDIDGDIGHSVVHYIFTGGYETLQTSLDDPNQYIPREFQRAVQVYYTAHKYQIHGLGELAKTYIEKFGDEIRIVTILKAVRKVYSRLLNTETWLRGYLHTKLQGAFDADENTFTRNEFYNSLGDDNIFNQAVMKMVVKIYASTVSSLRARAIEDRQVEPVPELHIEPDYPPTPRQSSLVMVPEDPPAGPVEADEVPVEACVEDACDLPAATPLDDWGSPVDRHSVPVY
ncbi:uncharacterized protein BDW47DRAFT_123824 [Aspergillus candidus]|uniref:BTB domain-containing protein n=1 Tax=Aspergillus candidus TaxID=41067 RepID=A0A2I2FI69_ASPCN|nr:hypothetical protein BDW47DRAFT_123824 [Aspergillus candidus]PLB40326.1 hypothetical protein BDW47DRAFT_123824 [Aspergillus candidus]